MLDYYAPLNFLKKKNPVRHENFVRLQSRTAITRATAYIALFLASGSFDSGKNKYFGEVVTQYHQLKGLTVSFSDQKGNKFRKWPYRIDENIRHQLFSKQTLYNSPGL